jgi:hypothetical protein
VAQEFLHVRRISSLERGRDNGTEERFHIKMAGCAEYAQRFAAII